MSVEAHPPFSLDQRMGFVYANGLSGNFLPDPSDTLATDAATNTEQINNGANIRQTVGDNQETGDFRDLTFNPVAYAITTTGYGFYIPSVLYDDISPPPGGAPMEATAETSATFTFTVDQDSNGNQWQVGAGVKYRNTLFEQTFTAEVQDVGGGVYEWVWTAGAGTTTDVELVVTAKEVDWSLNAGYTVTLACDETDGPRTLWDATFNFVYQIGYFDPVNPYWYGTTATVTIRQYIGYGATPPTYTYPTDYDPLGDNIGFEVVEFVPLNEAYT